MTDVASSILLTREQSTGSNTNLWGSYLIVTQRTTERASKGYQALAVTGDATISWTNYVATNDGAVAFLKLTGSLAASATLTFPAYQNSLTVWNAAGQTVTIKCSGGTGVAIPNGRKARIFCDATDYYFEGPNYVGDEITPTNDRDLVDYEVLTDAISAIAGATAGGLALYSATAPNANYIESIVTVGTVGGLSLTKADGGTASERGVLALDLTNLTVTTNVASTDRFAVYDATAGAIRYQTRALVVGKYGLIAQSEQTSGFTAAAGNLYPTNFSSAQTITFPASASQNDVIGVENYGSAVATFDWNGLKYRGETATRTTTKKGLAFFIYTNAATGWIDG